MIIRTKNICIVYVIITIVMLFYLVPQLMALEVGTHSAINKYIAQGTFSYIADANGIPVSFSLDDFLKKQLGMLDGNYTFFNNKNVFQWIRDGGAYEDKPPECIIPYRRSVNHYLNPLDHSGFSGLWGTELFHGVPADDWALSSPQSQYCGYYSWNDARQYYYQALTSTDKATRETNFAETFRAIGHVMHLVQDMSVPAHARNNQHILDDGYEIWSKTYILTDTLPIYIPTFFIPDANKSLNVQNLFFSNQYTKDTLNPGITLQGNIGLAEYTNANFLSPDTIFTGFDYPAYDGTTEKIDVTDPATGTSKLYLNKIGNGEDIDHLARATWFYKYLPADYKKYALTLNDEKVYTDYAVKLIPRAIGYSAQVLAQFFKGDIEISMPHRTTVTENGNSTDDVYALADGTAAGFNKINLMARNTSKKEMSGGEITLVVRYKLPAATEFTFVTAEENNQIIPKEGVKLTFDLTGKEIPFNATELYINLVYKGNPDSEYDGIAVASRDISEPTPIDFINIPWVCIAGDWYLQDSDAAVAKAFADRESGQSVNTASVCSDNNMKNIFIKISSLDTPENLRLATSTNYTYSHFEILLPGKDFRIYILANNESFYYSELVNGYYPTLWGEDVKYYEMTTVENQTTIDPTSKICCEIHHTCQNQEPGAYSDCCKKTYPVCEVEWSSPLISFLGKDRWLLGGEFTWAETPKCADDMENQTPIGDNTDSAYCTGGP